MNITCTQTNQAYEGKNKPVTVENVRISILYYYIYYIIYFQCLEK